MNNTVMLRGKGLGTAILFHVLLEIYPDATWKEPKLKWWQSTPRHEIRLQNLSQHDIKILEDSIMAYWPVATPVTMEVF
jgi:hypothetical protein